MRIIIRYLKDKVLPLSNDRNVWNTHYFESLIKLEWQLFRKLDKEYYDIDILLLN